MFKKSISILIALLMVISLALTGCGKKETAETNNQETQTTQETKQKVTIEFMHSQPEEERVSTIQKIIDDFMAKNPDIEVKQVPVPEDTYMTKLTTLISSQQLPVLMESNIDWGRLLYAEGVLDTAAHTEVIDAKGKDAFFKGALEILQAPDKPEYIGVPVSGWVAGIWYNKALFEEKKLAPPTTWDNILKAAKALHDPSKKKYGIVFATEESDFTEQTFTQIALSNNAELFDENGNPKFNSPEMKEAIKFYKELYKYSPKGSNGVTQVKDAFVGGNAAMAIYSTYIMPALYEQKMADKIGFAVPEKKTAAGFGMLTTIAISNMAKPEEREAAKKFISFMLEKESNITWLHMSPGGANPVLKEIASDEQYKSHELLKAFGETSSKVPEAFNELKMLGFQNGKSHPKMGVITSKLVIPKALNAILVQNANLDKEVEKAQKAMEEICKE
ncbi:Multiple sugar-binding protein precursor [Caloramator mitchellensis]|uniref:Multiple sugar-binding protein n=1 Tax=Caloramator mitchellensis TaxID=908809 RepID=A0A0R3K3V4_CALMK|nr:sugar ABC transporter substrate-binding protein [Caloramator mitchellensis]KRQ87618.1 Multiple sugar-binding protein precursor [Caloramator mitchellensis]